MKKIDKTNIPIRQLLFQKIQKGFDIKDYKFIQFKKQIKQLK